MKRKTLIILIASVLVVGIAATGITLYVMESNRQKQEDSERLLQENQYLDSVL